MDFTLNEEAAPGEHADLGAFTSFFAIPAVEYGKHLLSPQYAFPYVPAASRRFSQGNGSADSKAGNAQGERVRA